MLMKIRYPNTFTVIISIVYNDELLNEFENSYSTSDGLAFHPGEVEILLERFMLQKPG